MLFDLDLLIVSKAIEKATGSCLVNTWEELLCLLSGEDAFSWPK